MKQINFSVVLISCVLLFMGTMGCYADLRSGSTVPGPDKARLGRALLEQVRIRSGETNWKKQGGVTVQFKDEWRGLGKFLGWWPEHTQGVEWKLIPGSFTSQVKLLDGKSRGEVWGIQNWQAYKVVDKQLEKSKEQAITFYLPTLQYFFELPFRIHKAQVVFYQGRKTIRGKVYDEVFVTWGAYEISKEHDQFLLYISRESGLIEIAHYTVRDGARFATGTIYYEDFRDVGGVKTSFRQTVTLEAPGENKLPLSKNFFHRLTLKKVEFARTPDRKLLPFKGRGVGGDFKP